MQQILTSLQELDRLYSSDTLAEYEQRWQIAAQQIQRALPGFTIGYAEVYNSGTFRVPDRKMSHVLVPKQE